MKHIIYLFLLLMITGCSQTEISQVRQDVKFSTSIETGTRATDTHFEAGDRISVYAIKSDANTIVGNNVRYRYDNQFVSAGFPIYYPEDGTPLSFYAVFPYSPKMEKEYKFSVAEDQNTGENYNNSNLMTASTIETKELIPHLQFNHQMANILFSIQNNLEGLQISDVQLCQFAKTVTYDIFNDQLLAVDSADVCDITTKFQDGYYMALFPPQSKSKGQDLIYIKGWINGESVTFVEAVKKDIEFKAGYRYEYNITIDENSKCKEVAEFSPSLLLGTWESVSEYYLSKKNGMIIAEETYEDSTLRITFKEDGTAVQYEFLDGAWSIDTEIKWSFENGKIRTVEGEEESVINVLELTENSMVIEMMYQYTEGNDVFETYGKATWRKIA